MARVKLQIPEKLLFETYIRVRITDINYGNHLGNDALVSMLHEARVQWLNSHQFTELNIDGTGLIMSDLSVEYKQEAFAGEELGFSIFIGDCSSVSFDLFYSVKNQENKIIAQAKTGMVCFNYETRKVAQVPAGLKEVLEA